MGEARAYAEPLVVISGAAVFLLAKLVGAPQVRAYICGARWLHTSDFTQVLREVDAAACAWRDRRDQQQRSNAVRFEPDPPVGASLISVEQAGELLGLGRRRVQEMAKRKRIVSHKVAGRWQLDRASVLAYGEQRGRALCRTWNGSRDDITKDCHTATN
jgi:excisionase family DNA binding protein